MPRGRYFELNPVVPIVFPHGVKLMIGIYSREQ